MALKAVLESLDDVDENLKSLYVEKDGKFHLDLDDTIRSHPLVLPLANSMTNTKRERDQARAELKEAKKKLEHVPDDFDPDELSQLRAEAEARKDDPDQKDINKRIETATTAVKTQYETRLAAETKKWTGRITELEEANAGHEQWRKSTLTDKALTDALEANGVTRPSLRRGAKSMLERDVEIVEGEDGNFVARMKADLGGDAVDVFVKNWVATPDGKEYVEPAKGDGAPGSKSKEALARKSGDMGGDRSSRTSAIKSRFPELAKL